MNAKTRKSLIEFIEQVEFLAQGTAHLIGHEGVVSVYRAGENLKKDLKEEENAAS